MPQADAADIAAYQGRRPVGSREHPVFDKTLLTGTARVDPAKSGRKGIEGDLPIYERQRVVTKRTCLWPLNYGMLLAAHRISHPHIF